MRMSNEKIVSAEEMQRRIIQKKGEKYLKTIGIDKLHMLDGLSFWGNKMRLNYQEVDNETGRRSNMTKEVDFETMQIINKPCKDVFVRPFVILDKQANEFYLSTVKGNYSLRETKEDVSQEIDK